MLEAFAKDSLGALRTSAKYLDALGRILWRFSKAERGRAVVVVSAHDEALGARQTLRTLQRQLLSAGLLVPQVRSQGQGFAGEVFVHKPPSKGRTYRTYEEACRQHEGEGPSSLPVGITSPDVPY